MNIFEKIKSNKSIKKKIIISLTSIIVVSAITITSIVVVSKEKQANFYEDYDPSTFKIEELVLKDSYESKEALDTDYYAMCAKVKQHAKYLRGKEGEALIKNFRQDQGEKYKQLASTFPQIYNQEEISNTYEDIHDRIGLSKKRSIVNVPYYEKKLKEDLSEKDRKLYTEWLKYEKMKISELEELLKNLENNKVTVDEATASLKEINSLYKKKAEDATNAIEAKYAE